MNRTGSFSLFILVILSLASLSRAQAIFDNGTPGREHGWEMNEWIEADDFTLGSQARLHGVKFWEAEVGASFAGSVLWQVYANKQDNTPGALLFSGTSANLTHVATGFTIRGGFPEFLVTFDIAPPVVLPAGTYWLGLHNGPASNTTPRLSVFWEASSKVGGRPSYTRLVAADDVWYSNDFPGFPPELAFQVNGVFAPRITDIAFNGNAAAVSFTTTSGYNYRIDYKDDMRDTGWTAMPGYESVAGTGSVVTINDPDPNVRKLPHRFYRVVLL